MMCGRGVRMSFCTTQDFSDRFWDEIVGIKSFIMLACRCNGYNDQTESGLCQSSTPSQMTKHRLIIFYHSLKKNNE